MLCPVSSFHNHTMPQIPTPCTACTACTAGPTQCPVSVMVLRYSPPGGATSPAPVLELPPIPLGHPALEALAAGLAAASPPSAHSAPSTSEDAGGTASPGGMAAEATVFTQQEVPSAGLSVKQQVAAAVQLVRGALAAGAHMELPSEVQVRVGG